MSDTGPGGQEPQRARIRRAPKLGVFTGAGIVLGVLAALILAGTREPDPQVGFAATAGYLALYGIAAGALLGALVGVTLDAVLRRRSREAVVARDRIGGDDPAPVGDDPAPAHDDPGPAHDDPPPVP